MALWKVLVETQTIVVKLRILHAKKKSLSLFCHRKSNDLVWKNWRFSNKTCILIFFNGHFKFKAFFVHFFLSVSSEKRKENSENRDWINFSLWHRVNVLQNFWHLSEPNIVVDRKKVHKKGIKWATNDEICSILDCRGLWAWRKDNFEAENLFRFGKKKLFLSWQWNLRKI